MTTMYSWYDLGVHRHILDAPEVTLGALRKQSRSTHSSCALSCYSLVCQFIGSVYVVVAKRTSTLDCCLPIVLVLVGTPVFLSCLPFH